MPQYGIAVLDAMWRIVSASQAFVELTGYTRDEIQDLHLQDLIPDPGEILDYVEQGNSSWEATKILTPKSGAAVPMSFNLSSITDAQGTTAGFVIRLHTVPSQPSQIDVAGARQDFQQGRLEHELRNVFTSIIGNAQLIMGMDASSHDQTLMRRANLIEVSARKGMDTLGGDSDS